VRAPGILFALLGFLGLVAVVPIWRHFIGPRASSFPVEVQFLAALTLPATIAIYLASQLSPGGS
jgi:hypothetical protein